MNKTNNIDPNSFKNKDFIKNSSNIDDYILDLSNDISNSSLDLYRLDLATLKAGSSIDSSNLYSPLGIGAT